MHVHTLIHIQVWLWSCLSPVTARGGEGHWRMEAAPSDFLRGPSSLHTSLHAGRTWTLTGNLCQAALPPSQTSVSFCQLLLLHFLHFFWSILWKSFKNRALGNPKAAFVKELLYFCYFNISKHWFILAIRSSTHSSPPNPCHPVSLLTRQWKWLQWLPSSPSAKSRGRSCGHRLMLLWGWAPPSPGPWWRHPFLSLSHCFSALLSLSLSNSLLRPRKYAPRFWSCAHCAVSFTLRSRLHSLWCWPFQLCIFNPASPPDVQTSTFPCLLDITAR